MSAPVNITESNFEAEVLGSNEPIILDFWAPWCGPCRAVAPVLDRLATEFVGRVKVGKVNVDEQPVLAAAFRVRGIPMLAVMKDGRLVDEAVGFSGAGAVMALFEKHARPAAAKTRAA